MKHPGWFIAMCAMILSATPCWAQRGHGLLHFEVSSADTRVTSAGFDPIGTVRDNAAGAIALLCAAVQRESNSLVASDAGKALIDRPGSGAGNRWLEVEAETHDVDRFLGRTPQRHEYTRSRADRSGTAPNLVNITW